MKLSPTLNDALNQQVLEEFRNFLAYTQMASFFEDLQLKKIAHYFYEQAQQEKDHANLFVHHINDRTGGKVTLGEVDGPAFDFSSVGAVAEAYIAVEEQTSASIEELYGLALDEKSYLDLPFLQAMLSEQVEEEDSAQEFAAHLKQVKDLVLFDASLEA